MEELFDSLKNWGCDVDGALARFIGDRELYRSCLHTAAGDQNFELLPEALRAGEMGRAFECAHTLKGMLANMGLIPLCVMRGCMRNFCGMFRQRDRRKLHAAGSGRIA